MRQLLLVGIQPLLMLASICFWDFLDLFVAAVVFGFERRLMRVLCVRGMNPSSMQHELIRELMVLHLRRNSAVACLSA